MDAKRATLKDVAAAAGVSRSLAGFVLGDDHGKSIPESTRESVRAAARNLGYAPHGIARALREGSSRVVVLSIDPSLESNYSRTFARGLDEELSAHGGELPEQMDMPRLAGPSFDRARTRPGTEVTVIWGRPGTRQREIRATVTALPFKPDHRRVDVSTL
jgi:Bacterial regulatory proteins, lacI family